MRVIKKEYKIEQFLSEYRTDKSKVLNIGSGYAALGDNCVNLDIQNKLGVGITGDGHSLPFKDCSFDICILSAVLQYCRNFFKVKDEVYRVLKPGGYLYIDAPFVQPYCIDTPDLYRFSKDGLLNIFKDDFSIIDCDISIAGGSALAFYCKSVTNYIFLIEGSDLF